MASNGDCDEPGLSPQNPKTRKAKQQAGTNLINAVQVNKAVTTITRAPIKD